MEKGYVIKYADEDGIGFVSDVCSDYSVGIDFEIDTDELDEAIVYDSDCEALSLVNDIKYYGYKGICSIHYWDGEKLIDVAADSIDMSSWHEDEPTMPEQVAPYEMDTNTYMFVIEDWDGHGHSHYHTFDSTPTLQEIIKVAEQFVDGKGMYPMVEVSRMIDTNEGEFYKVIAGLQNKSGKLFQTY